MPRKQQKRKHSALIHSEEEEEQRQYELKPEPSMENNTSNNTTEAKHEGLQDEEDLPDNSTNNMDNQSSSNSIAHLTDFMDSLANENQLDSATRPKRARFIPDSNAIFDDYNSLELPLLNIPPVQSPSSSSSTENYHSFSGGLTDSSNSLTSDRDLLDSDNGSDDNLLGERFPTSEVHEVIDLSSPALPRDSSDIVDLTLEPNSPTRSNFVDLTRESVEQSDSSPIIVSVNKIYQRRSVIESRPSCRFQVTPSCSSNQEHSTAEENHICDADDDISVENLAGEHSVNNNSYNGSTSCGESKRNKEKEQFDKSITCPICLDDVHLIKRKRQLSSTTCGHVFCDKCIKNAIKTQSRCPTCRKKLTLRQIHPLFL
ncbi:E3 ubiquitin-protein ligase complex slx8-rfp subunit slx8-like [Actinia tenebrosa]|uniref:E3 ubiquitin-protein ligase complex slx8-rfp subunit slx8-like n=1 Tax=Actinia tenebrosa TaxID=6105 RepID=A0A6P8IT78_ACTTE|nr:E3 ubiquitin-protein ligase complex slx8-rfp subunit slx8-like [Actinia tenebrosa]